MPKPKTSDRRPGFTLGELLIVLALVALVAGLVVPAAVSLSPSQTLSAARLIASDLRYVQSRAMVLGRPLTVSFDPTQQRYTVSDEDGLLAHPWAPSERFDGRFVVALGAGTPFPRVRLAGVDFGGRTWLQFGSMGEPIESGSLVVRHGEETVTVVVEPSTGAVRLTP